MLFTLALVLTHALAIQASLLSHSYPGDDINALCARKSVDLTTFSQLKQLGEAVGSSTGCSSTLKEAITELVQLIETGKDDLCSESSINSLRAYYVKYLDTSVGPVGDNEADKELLPKSLKRFVLAYGRILVDARYFEEFDMLIKDGGPAAQVLDVIANPGEVFLPGDLIPFLRKNGVKTSDEQSGDKLIMQTSTASYIKRFQFVCQQRFKPIYGPLMMPLVRLVNMGFDYKDEPLRLDLASPKIVHDVSKWSRVVFLCEALANVRLVAGEDDHARANEGVSLVRILTKDEADAIEAEAAAAAHAKSEELEDWGLEPGMFELIYEPVKKITLRDEIYNKADKQLMKAIKSFKTDRGEEYILRKRLTKKGFELIKKQLRSGHLGLIFSAAWKGMMRKRGGGGGGAGQPIDSPTKVFVESLNEMVEQQQSGNSQDGAISSSSDKQNYFVMELVMSAIILVIVVGAAVGLFFAVGAFG